MTSHAAVRVASSRNAAYPAPRQEYDVHTNNQPTTQVVARGMGKCCVSGCHSLHVDYEGKRFTTAEGDVIKQGDVITLDGTTGEVQPTPTMKTAHTLQKLRR